MRIQKRLRDTLARFLEVPTSDPDDTRRRRLLNIILLGVLILIVLMTIIVFTMDTAGVLEITPQEASIVYITSAAIFAGAWGFYALNRSERVPGWVASGLFMLFLLVMIAFTDLPGELVDGRSLFVFAIPIVMASMLLRPESSFLFAILASLEMYILAQVSDTDVNTIAMIGFLMLALISWLSARSLEQTLKELRTINRELDNRVELRTSELAAALARELAEAGKTEAILQGIADGVAVFDMNGRTIVANPTLSRFLGRQQAVLMGVTLDRLLPRYDVNEQERQAVINLLKNPDENAPSLRFTINERTLSVNAAPVDTGMGERIGTVAVFRDFTHEAEVEQMKNDFVAMVSHELRTPLNAILGYTEMLREAVYGPVSEQQTGVVKRIESNSQRLLRIVSDLLDQARIEAGQLSFHYTTFKPASLLEFVHSVMDKAARNKNLTLTGEIDPALPASLRGDPQRLGQILINLVNNAVKFTQQGEIIVRLEPHDEHSWACIVRDTGPGIPPETQPFVFDPFRQVDGVATREHGGIGLGLSIVKRLVKLMGGDVVLESEVGRGSTFTVTLPYQPPEEKK